MYKWYDTGRHRYNSADPADRKDRALYPRTTETSGDYDTRTDIEAIGSSTVACMSVMLTVQD